MGWRVRHFGSLNMLEYGSSPQMDEARGTGMILVCAPLPRMLPQVEYLVQNIG